MRKNHKLSYKKKHGKLLGEKFLEFKGIIEFSRI